MMMMMMIPNLSWALKQLIRYMFGCVSTSNRSNPIGGSVFFDKPAMDHPFVICSSKCVSQEVCNIHQGIHHVISLHCIVKLHRGSSGSLIGHVLFSRIIGSNM